MNDPNNKPALVTLEQTLEQLERGDHEAALIRRGWIVCEADCNGPGTSGFHLHKPIGYLP